MTKTDEFPFESAEVYKEALAFTESCRKIANSLPKGCYSDSDQLRRASLSICNNIAEGYGRWHIKEKQQFFTIARGSAYECLPMLTILAKENKIEENELDKMRSTLAKISKMLSAMIQCVAKRPAA